MAIRIPWDKHEAAILLDACLAVIDNRLSRVDAISKVSRTLREKAIRKGYVIDPVYRNENGISMQLNIMMALILEIPSGLHGASKLFIDIVHLYKTNPEQFQKVLENAKKGGIVMPSNKEDFYRWLDSSVHPSDVLYIKKDCDLVDTYSKNNIKLKYSLFETNQLADIQKVINVIKKDVFFRAKNERQIQKIEKALNEYFRFMKEFLSHNKSAFTPEEKRESKTNRCGDEAIISERNINTNEKDFLDVDFEQYKKILSKDYKKGFRLNDKLSLKRFRMQWQCTFKNELQYTDEAICKHIAHITIHHGDMAYLPEDMLNENTKCRLLTYITTLFSEGKSAIYYEALYHKFADDFAIGRINNPEMLKTYLSYVNEGNMYLHKSYITSDSNVEIDNTDEVRSFLIAQEKPMRTENIIFSMPHISKDKIREVIAGANSSEFVRNKKGEYFHADIIKFTQQEIGLITEWISNSIADKKYMGGKELIDTIQTKLPSIMERYSFLTWLGLRDVLAYKLKNVFSFKGQIISAYGEDLSMSDIFANFAKTHEHFTLTQLDMLKSDLDTSIYFDSVYANSLRINKNDFVSVDQARFDIDATDIVIGQFCCDDFISIKEISLFGGFPNAYFPWNQFLLQHYVANYSKKYKLIHTGFTATKPVGAIVKRDSQINRFDDVIIRVLAESKIPLNVNDALQYLYDTGYISRRSYNSLDTVLVKANQYRKNKGE